jgi:pyrroloquinoline quinone biosynthesis protein B
MDESPPAFCVMKTIVLGSAAGGGYPQWNCGCAVCSLYWMGDARVRRRTQSSVAVSVDGTSWALLNCSPDIREQIGATGALKPKALRHSPVTDVVLTNADIDHIAGLLTLREMQPLTIWASAKVQMHLKSNSVFSVLNSAVVNFETIETGHGFSPFNGLDIEAFDVSGKVPLYQEAASGHAVSRNGNTIGLHVRSNNRQLSYVPGCGDIDAQLLSDLQLSDALLFDGTLFSDDEMILSGTGQKTGRRMGHVSVSGEGSSIKGLETLGCKARYFVHMNNTNPILIEGSPERRHAEAAGWIVSHDGLEIVL